MNGFLFQGQDHEVWTLWGVGQQVTKLIRKSTILLIQYPWQTPVWIHLVSSSHYRFTDSRYSNLRVKLWRQFHVQKSGCLQETWLESPVSIKAFQPTDISFAFFCFMLFIWFSEALDHLMLWQIIWNDKRSCSYCCSSPLSDQSCFGNSYHQTFWTSPGFTSYILRKTLLAQLISAYLVWNIVFLEKLCALNLIYIHV